MNEWVVIGKFGRPHGLNGLIKIYSFTHPADNFIEYTPRYALINKKWQAIAIKDVAVHHKYILAKIEGFDGRDAVSTLTNIEIGIQEHQLPKLDNNEFYWHQLIGLKVVNQNNIELGEITEIIATGSNDVLVIQNNGKRHLVPYLSQFIIKIDMEHSTIIVDWDENF